MLNLQTKMTVQPCWFAGFYSEANKLKTDFPRINSWNIAHISNKKVSTFEFYWFLYSKSSYFSIFCCSKGSGSSENSAYIDTEFSCGCLVCPTSARSETSNISSTVVKPQNQKWLILKISIRSAPRRCVEVLVRGRMGNVGHQFLK